MGYIKRKKKRKNLPVIAFQETKERKTARAKETRQRTLENAIELERRNELQSRGVRNELERKNEVEREELK